MPNLTESEREILREQFPITPQAPQNGFSFITGEELLDRDRCRSFLAFLAEKMNGVSLVTAASQFAKKYSFSVIAPALYAMSVLNKGLEIISPENVSIEPVWKQEKLMFQLHLNNWSAYFPGEERERWRKWIVHSLFREHVAVLWRHLHTLTGLPLSVLWENAAIYVYWLYETKITGGDSEGTRRAKEDFHYLLNEAPSTFFLIRESPLKKFHTPKIWGIFAEEPVRVRKTCCLYYQVNVEGICCNTCPRAREKQMEVCSLLNRF